MLIKKLHTITHGIFEKSRFGQKLHIVTLYIVFFLNVVEHHSSQSVNFAPGFVADNFKAFKNPDGLRCRDFSFTFFLNGTSLNSIIYPKYVK